MKAIALALSLLAAFSISARGDFTIVQKVEGKGEMREIVLKIKGDKIRMEASPKMTMIVDGRTGEMITLMNTQKRIVRISGDKTKAIAEMATKYNGTTSEKTKIVATGKKMTINGYEAEEYIAESKAFKAHYWIALNFPNSAEIMKQLQAIIPAAWTDLAKGMMDYRDLPGFPLRTQVNLGDGDVVSTLVALKTDALNDAEFLPPKDFTEMKVPNIKISGDTPEPRPSAKP
jgi:Domain of unknown function (DUF4412)